MTLDHARFQEWLDRYVAAWKSYDAKAIGDLFSEDTTYRYHPKSEPLRGREAIVADWLRERDDPGTYDGHYEPLAIDGDNHVAHGWTRYFGDDGAMSDEYWNIYLCRFDDEGRCRDFTEWWIQSREFAHHSHSEADHANGASLGDATA